MEKIGFRNMKVLWFTNTPSLYDQGKHHYYGCGWIESLEKLLENENNIDLGICFFHKTDSIKTKINNTTYYPLLKKSSKKNPLKAVLKNWQGKVQDKDDLIRIMNVIDDFSPDIIHVFGTEGVSGLIQDKTNIPVVIHLQGLINPCLNSYLPPNHTILDFLLNSSYLLDHLIGISPIFDYKKFKNLAKRENNILRNAKYVMGRTNWDKSISEFYNKQVTYFHIDEVLRPEFYMFTEKTNKTVKNLTIISTLSPTIYKGIDLVLKTANLLVNRGFNDFEWKIIGLNENDKLLKHFEKKLKINHRTINVKCLGRKNASELKSIMLSADIFVHPSYIDNSPNSVCEAQILGIPVIATNVGGVNSIVEDKQTGMLVPSNGAFEIASIILKYYSKKDYFVDISKNSKLLAIKRHNKEKILKDLVKVYHTILN